MAKPHRPEDIVTKLRQVDVLAARGIERGRRDLDDQRDRATYNVHHRITGV